MEEINLFNTYKNNIINIFPWKIGNILYCSYSNINNFKKMLDENAFEIIETVWKKEKSRNINRKYLYNGKLARLSLLKVSPNRKNINLYTELTNYKEYVGSRDILFKNYLKSIKKEIFSNPLGVSIVIETKDKKIIIGKRKKNETNSNFWYIPGGFIDPGKDVANSIININKVIIRETTEELGKVSFIKMKSTGFSYDCKKPHPEIHFYGKTKEDSAKILKLAKKGEEFSEWAAVRANQDVISKLLFDKKEKVLSAAGTAAIFLYGNYTFGSKWSRKNKNCIKGMIL